MKYQFKERRPFNFLGHFSLKQKKTLLKWLQPRLEKFEKIKEWHQMRAHRLRKTAGLLEDFYKTKREGLEPFFKKEVWAPDADGHFHYVDREKALPDIAMTKIKEPFMHQMQLDDEGVFRMDRLRTLIEHHEDEAQYAKDAPDSINAALADIDRYFGQPEYRATLVDDESDLYEGEPRFRVHQLLEAPTKYERFLISHADKK